MRTTHARRPAAAVAVAILVPINAALLALGVIADDAIVIAAATTGLVASGLTLGAISSGH